MHFKDFLAWCFCFLYRYVVCVGSARSQQQCWDQRRQSGVSRRECFHCCWRFTNYQSLPDELLAPAIKLYANTTLLNAMISVVVEDQDVNRRSIWLSCFCYIILYFGRPSDLLWRSKTIQNFCWNKQVQMWCFGFLYEAQSIMSLPRLPWISFVEILCPDKIAW